MAPPPPPSMPEKEEIQPIKVIGSAQFGNQCPFGTYVPPQAVPLELWSCPLSVPEVELTEPLRPLILQADCKKKTLDVRNEYRSLDAETWEVMPDGTFFFSMNVGSAKLKDDGAGHKNCQIPVSVNMWGKLDCKDRDKVNIKLETVWWLGKVIPSSLPSGFPSSLPSSSPSSSPSVLPSFRPSATPLPLLTPTAIPAPTLTPTPVAIFTPIPLPTPSRNASPTPIRAEGRAWTFPHVRVSPAESAIPDSSACQLPPGCYFHALVTLDQCS